ncbi:MAG: hypothetical protein V1779_07275 [bacterium]
MKTLIILSLLCLNICISNAQVDSTKQTVDYNFIIMDSPAQLFTMRQFNQDYLSLYRLSARGLNNSVNEYVSDVIQVWLISFFLMPLTHEEGHRSILTAKNIGAISQPYFNKDLAAYVKGVSDETLKNLRDNDLPNYIRLHTAGLESDYMLTKRVENIGSFEKDEFKNFKWEYWLRKLAILQYYVSGLFQLDVDIEEEENELERDIVGFDTYGAARHLYRPDMKFYRYTKYKDLSSEEAIFIKRIGARSFLNLINPLMLGIENFKITDNLKLNAGLGYTMSPFGDFIDENIWLKYKELNLSVYARQFQNKNNWFNGFGISLFDFHLFERLDCDISGHYWEQPKDLDFNTAGSLPGGAFDMDLRYFFIINKNSLLKAYSFDLGLLYKSKGFLPEELFLNEHFTVRLGTTLRF